MRVALIAPPFIPVPPKKYGGTELFMAQLAEGLQKQGSKSWFTPTASRQLRRNTLALREAAVADRRRGFRKSEGLQSRCMGDPGCEPGLRSHPCATMFRQSMSRLISLPMVYTIHHVHEDLLSKFYAEYPGIDYVTISEFQRNMRACPGCAPSITGSTSALYSWQGGKREYLSFLGRIAPMKGTHLAIEVAKRTGIPLKIAGEVQPCFKDYLGEPGKAARRWQVHRVRRRS